MCFLKTNTQKEKTMYRNQKQRWTVPFLDLYSQRFFSLPSLCSSLYCRRTDYNKAISQRFLSVDFQLYFTCRNNLWKIGRQYTPLCGGATLAVTDLPHATNQSYSFFLGTAAFGLQFQQLFPLTALPSHESNHRLLLISGLPYCSLLRL